MKTRKYEKVALVQKHQLDNISNKLSELESHLDDAQAINEKQNVAINDIENEMANLFEDVGIDINDVNTDSAATHSSIDLSEKEKLGTKHSIGVLNTLDFDESMSWQNFVRSVDAYAHQNDIDLTGDPFDRLLSDSQRVAIEQRLKEEFTIKNAQCDKYDYMIAGTCGLIGGLIDILFVGLPGKGGLTKVTDNSIKKMVEQFASLNGWQGGREGSDSTKSAIGFLERNFKVNYDHRHSADVGGQFLMSTQNHHVKSLGHSPDLVGLFFSIVGQLTDKAYFVDNGKLIAIDTETFELQGGNFIAKIFSGFVNWLGHLFSDMAGSSGASGRGSGIPIPFYSMLQFLNVGDFGKHRQTFAKIAVQVFEQGYDLRHGLALAIPVMVTELLTRFMWSMKQRFYHEKPWNECMPSASNPELRRMLLVAHGSLCLIDTTDAALRSGGQIIKFLLRTNIIAWIRFGNLALRELSTWYNSLSGHLDTEAIGIHLECEYKKMLAQ